MGRFEVVKEWKSSTAKCYPCDKGNHRNCDIQVEDTHHDCACMNPNCVYLRTETNVN